MATRKYIETEIESLASLGGVVSTYKEIAATRITRTRNSVVKSHNFLSEINKIFEQVKSSYKSEVKRLAKQKKVKDMSKLSFVKHNSKTIYVFISSNTGLYGDIVERTFRLFEKNVKASDAAISVIGRLGLSLLQAANFPPPYIYFDFPDQTVNEAKLREIAAYLIRFEKVVVFYQEFQTIVKQEPVVSDISGNALSTSNATSSPTPVVKFLFEPSLEGILEFFEKQIFSSILEQTIRDSQLAKFASRLVTLDAAAENIHKRIFRMAFEATRLKHREKNKKQNQTFSSMKLWT